jgi:hypothetical protein
MGRMGFSAENTIISSTQMEYKKRSSRQLSMSFERRKVCCFTSYISTSHYFTLVEKTRVQILSNPFVSEFSKYLTHQRSTIAKGMFLYIRKSLHQETFLAFSLSLSLPFVASKSHSALPQQQQSSKSCSAPVPDFCFDLAGPCVCIDFLKDLRANSRGTHTHRAEDIRVLGERTFHC